MHGNSLANPWQGSGNCMATVWQLLGNGMATAWQVQAVAGPIEQSVKVALPQVGAVSKTGSQIVGYMEEDLGKWDKNLSID